MKYNLKRVLAFLIVVIVVFGWVVSFKGIGPVKPLKDEMKMGLDIEGGVFVVMEAQTDKKGKELQLLMEQTQAVIENRVNQLGLSEPIVTIEGEQRIRVELPGAKDAEDAIKVIGKTAQLQFLQADGTLVLDGSMVKNATTNIDNEKGGYTVGLEFNSEGADKFMKATEKALSGTVTPINENVSSSAIMIVLDGDVISAPNVQSVIPNGKAEISGNFTQETASNLAALIRGGSLPVELKEINTSIQTATIGVGALDASVKAGIIGLLLIFLVMLIAYRGMGLFANIALALYIIMDLWILVLMDAVLTLPGIAGIILSIGMAVDANVIIFTRIKEELAAGRSIRSAVQAGFKRALSTVLDSQITTIIAAVVLYQIGTSSVRGFAITLIIGILLSIFTAVVVTQLFLSIMARSSLFSKKSFFGVNEDNSIKMAVKKTFSFVKNRKIYYTISIAIVVIGLAVGGIRGFNFGIDFVGGTMMEINMGKEVAQKEIESVLKKHDVSAQIVYSGEKHDRVIIRTIQSLDHAKRVEIMDDFKSEFGVDDKALLAAEQFGPSVGKELKHNAVKAVLIAALGMLIYIIIRFEWKFGVAALLGVLHDVLVVIAFYGIFHLTINNPFIAGILTVVGYSINDTIVVFDRIRENAGFKKRTANEAAIDLSINQTLTRSIMTSFTTLLVMLPLFIMVSSSIRGFILPLMIGVLTGCMSSIFVCSPLYYDLTRLLSKPASRYHRSAKGKKKVVKDAE